MSAPLFELTVTFKAAVGLINAVDPQRFPLLLGRLIRTISKKHERAFSLQEEEQLQKVLSLSEGDLHTLFEACSFIFEQAAYHALQPQILGQHLQQLGMQDAKIVAFQRVWEVERESVLSALSDRSLVPQVLDEVGWRLHLQLAATGDNKLKQPTAIFEFKLRGTDDSNEENLKRGTERFDIEFNHSELLKFFDQLETIQEQLDTLGSS